MRRGSGGGRAARLALWLLGVVVVLLGLAQLLLPKFAADRISSRVGRYGKVTSVHVSAWPAVKLLFKDADSISVRAHDIALSPARTDALLAEAIDGKLVAHPRGPLVEALRVTLFSEPHVRLDSIAAHPATGPNGESGYALEASATLR